MKKRTLSKLKAIFSSKKDKRQLQEQPSSKSRSPTPEPAREAAPANESFRSLLRTPPPSRAGPPPSPPVPTHPIAPVPPEPSGPLPLLPCQICGRTFVPQSLAKHAKICEKMMIKKRKTFDSSRQRREGTDLEQYLPKNFGLPENSPFLEKSPPNTAKVTLKPKVQSVRNTITKPTAELQKCPHCNRAFGVRAFERHVEWCADKAKILPAAPAQPPQHIADAKQRLNARTQYKAPPVRGRRSSQSRDKSSNSRSASVDSSRGVSPPPPREYGDYNKHGRTRASESISSNDCHDDSPHVPVIRNSRHSQYNSSGDANIKARQARLARDLSSTRNTQESHSISIQPSNTDSKIKKNEASKNKVRSKMGIKNEIQLKKLEELANKYSEKSKETITKIPVFKKTSKIVISQRESNCREEKEIKSNANIGNNNKNVCELNHKEKINTRKKKPDESNSKKRQLKHNIDNYKQFKESTMSLDSLEDPRPVCRVNKNCQSIGINTEFMCPSIPCVIYDNTDLKSTKNSSSSKDKRDNSDEPKTELLYQNLFTVSSTEITSKECTEIESNEKLPDTKNKEYYLKSTICVKESSSGAVQKSCNKEEIENKKNIDIKYSSEENKNIVNSLSNFAMSYEHNDYGQSFQEENKPDDINDSSDQDIMCRHGSGDTYTKFTENPADLEEFIEMTDKIMDNQKEDNLDIEFDNIHTPRTNSLEAITQTPMSQENSHSNTEMDRHHFSDTIESLKTQLKDLLNSSTNSNKPTQSTTTKERDLNKNVCDMEHITVYQVETQSEQHAFANKPLKIDTSELKLPSILETNKIERRAQCNKNKIHRLYKSRKNKNLAEQKRLNIEHRTFIVRENTSDNSDGQSITCEAPPLKLPRIENKRLEENYDPFASAARQMKELMSSETNIPKKLQTSTKDSNRTLPILRPGKDKTLPTHLRTDNTKMMKDTLNKTYQKTPTLQRMKSFGSTNNDSNNSSLGSRCSSFRVNRNEKKSSQKLNTTFTKASKENISTVEKTYFNRNSNLNRSFSSYTASSYSTPKPKDKIPKISTSMYHSFQRTTINQPIKLDKINKDDDRKNFVNLDSILVDDNSSMTDSNYIDPRLINENDNLPINVNTILNNPDIISSMESLLTTEHLPFKFESFSSNHNNNNNCQNNKDEIQTSAKENGDDDINSNIINKKAAPIINGLSDQYDKIISSLENSIISKASRDESVCEAFDLEEFMTSFDEEIIKHKLENKRTCSSTTRIVRKSEHDNSNKSSQMNSTCSTPKTVNSNGLIPVNKSMSLNFSINNMNENFFPSSVKRSTSLLDSIQKKTTQKSEGVKTRHKVDQLEQDLMQSLKDFDKFYESDKIKSSQSKEINCYNMQLHNGTAKKQPRLKSERTSKKNEAVSNGNHTSNGKTSNDSAYSSLNRISPSKLSICNSQEPNGLVSLEQIPAVSDSSEKEEIRSVSSEEFLAMERSAELDEPVPQPDIAYRESENLSNDKRAASRASSRRSPTATWARGGGGGGGGVVVVSSSGSEASLHRPRLSRFCHECGHKFPVDTAKFCIECGVKRLLV